MVSLDGETSRLVRQQVEHRFTWTLIQIARYHALQAKRAPEGDHWGVRANVVSAVCMACASLESAYYEFIHSAA